MNISVNTHRDFLSGEMTGFYTEAYPSLLMFAARMLGDTYAFLAEDCTQDAIYKAYERRGQFQTPAHLKSFLYQCVHNQAISILRKHQSQQRFLLQQDVAHDGNTDIIEQETLDLLFQAIDRLPEELRKVFELSFEEGLNNAEVAAKLGISESGVKKRKARMISMLRHQFVGHQAIQLLISLLLC